MIVNAKLSIDYLAAEAAHCIAKVIGEKVKGNKEVSARDLENLATKALGVLQSQGVYAMMLFLISRSGKETNTAQMSVEERVAVQLVSWLWPLRTPEERTLEKLIIKETGNCETDMSPCEVNGKKQEILQEYTNLTKELDRLLLVRDLYERVLIYTRYYAKASRE